MKCPFCSHTHEDCNLPVYLEKDIYGIYRAGFCSRRAGHSGYCVHCEGSSHCYKIRHNKLPKEILKLKI
jgi:hypothetical protein